jgi:hypothetical protein
MIPQRAETLLAASVSPIFEAGERLVLGTWTRQPDDGETVGEH